MEILDVLNARIYMRAEAGEISTNDMLVAQRVLGVIFAVEDPTEILTAIENATWMDKTVHEVGHPAPVSGVGHAAAHPIEGVDTWPQDEFGREIDPGLKS